MVFLKTGEATAKERSQKFFNFVLGTASLASSLYVPSEDYVE